MMDIFFNIFFKLLKFRVPLALALEIFLNEELLTVTSVTMILLTF